MKLNVLTFAAAMLATTPMVAAPALAAPVSNPAASLSVAGARVGSPTVAKNKLAGGSGGIFALLIVAGVIAIGVVAIVKDDNSDSN